MATLYSCSWGAFGGSTSIGLRVRASDGRRVAQTSSHARDPFVCLGAPTLALQDPYDVIIDGANVGFNNQNHEGGQFQYHQIDAVVLIPKGMRSCTAQRTGEIPSCQSRSQSAPHACA